MRIETTIKNGKKYRLVPDSYYNKLVEDAETLVDMIAYEEYKRNEDSTEFFPIDFVRGMVDGKNPLLAFREYRGLTQEQLAKKAKVTRNHISQIESGKRKGSVALLKNLANVLKIDIDMLV